MNNWITLTFLYAVFTGFFQCTKKKAVEKDSIYDVLAWFSLIAFLFVALTCKNVLDVEPYNLLIIFGKSSVVVIAWLLSLFALSRMPVSLYSVINLSRMIFSIILSIIFLGEKITFTILIGIIVVLSGLVLVNRTSNNDKNREASLKVIIILLFACLCNSISAIIDKKILGNITSSQLQFWFLLFLTIIYWVILLIKKRRVNFKCIKKNYWIIIMAVCLTLGDKLLFMANEIPDSKVSIMTIIKQFSSIELIILGKIMFNEKNIIKKLLCSILVILGIIITLI